MKQTLDNIAYEVIELIRANRVDDSEIDLRLIKERINDLRALYLRRELSTVRSVEQVFVQDLGCVPVEVVDPIECDDISGDNYILRTTVDIPAPIEIPGRLLFTRIGPVDKTLPGFNYYNYAQSYYNSHKRFGKDLINTYYRNNRIYIYANDCVDFIKLIDEINIQMVADSPEDVMDNPCFETSEIYPISRWLKENIIKTIVPEMVDKLSIPADTSNDDVGQ